MKYNELMMQTDSKLKNTVTIINRKESVTMSEENKNTLSEYEYTFPTVKDNIRPCVSHLNLMNDKSRY